MRKVVLRTFVSLDGVMQAPGGPEEDPTGGFRFGGWAVPYFDEAMGEAVDGFMNDPFDLLLGRKTYEIFAAHWPFIGEEERDSDIARKFAAARKYVAASAHESLPWEGSVNVGDDLVGAVRRLKGEDGPNLLIQGSSELVHALLHERLIDEFTVMTSPVLLGRGKKLFGEALQPTALELIRHSVSRTGALIATYRPVGDVQTGSFALDTVTPAEAARRERMARED